MSTLARVALARTDGDAWIALETDDIEGTLEDLDIELSDVRHEVIRVDALDDAALTELDRTRVRHVGRGTVVLIGHRGDLERVARVAPHTWSLVGPDYHVIEPAPPLDVAARLGELSVATGLTNEQVLQRAARGELSRDPLWAEWLALLGEGGLLGE
ncbi:MAG: hypothetical protein H6736_12035 [Alphaproteobacteria bacterium]|nr:hypothetical protein [Alphaproteobacteria bacterium]MCB9692534.1 hypothetical protein [Alphaproteobacteria bacterium]